MFMLNVDKFCKIKTCQSPKFNNFPKFLSYKITCYMLYRGVLYVEVILYSKECNWYTRCCPLNGGTCTCILFG